MATVVKPYQPSAKILERYAQVLVKYALNSGAGVKPGEVVQLAVPDVAKSLGLFLQNEVLKAGAHPLFHMLPTGMDADFYNLASPEQLTFFPKKYLKARTELIDHQIVIIADVDPHELSKVDPARIFMMRDAKKEYRDWLTDKENNGKFTWTAALWGVEAKATEVGLSLKQYWQQIIDACFLDDEDPVGKWREVAALQHTLRDHLNALEIEYVHVEGEDVNLKIKLGPERLWMGGSGRNIPSFELFTSPDWRGTEGWIKFNQPLYRYGNIVKDIELHFHQGLVTEAKARKGNAVLQQMLKTTNANKLGEFSLTDSRMSRITHVMAETLFDENIGGKYGNTHVAIGMAYKDCFRGDPSKVSKKEWEKMGYNDSAEHTDFVSTTNRTVTAYLTDGSSQLIYKDGRFVW